MDENIFGSTTPPRWLDPNEEQLKWRSEADIEGVHQTQEKVALGTLALDQQNMDLKRQQVGAQLVSQGIQNNEAALALNQKMAGMNEWNDMVNESGGDQSKLYNGSPPTNPVALERWNAGRAAWSQSTAQQATQSVKTNFFTSLSDKNTMDDLGRARVNDALQNGGLNPDGTPKASVLELLGNEQQRVIEAKQAREVELKATPNIYRNQGIEAVAKINQDTRLQTSQTMADSRIQVAQALAASRENVANIRTTSDLALQREKIASLGDKTLDAGQAEFLKQQLEGIEKDTTITDPKEKAGMMAGAYRAFAEMRLQQQQAKAAAPNATPPPASSNVRVKSPDGRIGTIPSSQLDDALGSGYQVLQ